MAVPVRPPGFAGGELGTLLWEGQGWQRRGGAGRFPSVLAKPFGQMHGKRKIRSIPGGSQSAGVCPWECIVVISPFPANLAFPGPPGDFPSSIIRGMSFLLHLAHC